MGYWLIDQQLLKKCEQKLQKIYINLCLVIQILKDKEITYHFMFKKTWNGST